MDTECTTETEEACAMSNVRMVFLHFSISYMFIYQVTVVRKYNATECSTTYETECTPVQETAITTVNDPKENCVEKPIETCEIIERQKIEKVCKNIPVTKCKQVKKIRQKEAHFQECSEMTEENCTRRRGHFDCNRYKIVPYKECKRLDCDSSLTSD